MQLAGISKRIILSKYTAVGSNGHSNINCEIYGHRHTQCYQWVSNYINWMERSLEWKEKTDKSRTYIKYLSKSKKKNKMKSVYLTNHRYRSLGNFAHALTLNRSGSIASSLYFFCSVRKTKFISPGIFFIDSCGLLPDTRYRFTVYVCISIKYIANYIMKV